MNTSNLVAVRVHDGDQTLAHLLFLITVDLQGHAGQLLEIGLVGQHRLRDRIVVGEKGDRRALELHPVEIGGVRLRADGNRENGQRDMRREHPGLH